MIRAILLTICILGTTIAMVKPSDATIQNCHQTVGWSIEKCKIELGK